MSALNPEKALIFRITHVANVPWLLDHGLHCHNSSEFDPNFRNIGNPDLISRRHQRAVAVAPAASQQLQTELQRRNLSLQAVVRPGWYF